MIRVIAFDDNAGLRDSLSLLLNEADGIQLIKAFSDCNNIIKDIQETSPDLIIMDIDMPGIDGIEGVKMVRKHFPDIQILMQTVFDDDVKVFSALKAGAGGYILKNTEPQKLVEAIYEVSEGGAPMSPGVARKVIQQFQLTGTLEKNEDFHLSSRESEVLGLLVKGKSYKMIADELKISYDTVRAHMKKIYEKLHVTSMTEAVAKAINERFFGIF